MKRPDGLEKAQLFPSDGRGFPHHPGCERRGAIPMRPTVTVEILASSRSFATAPTVDARTVSYRFDADTAPKQVLFDIDFTLDRGEFVILTGPSGSGKTTLLTLVGALRAMQTGSMTVFGTELAGLDAKGQRDIRRRTGFIFQDHNLFDALTAVQT